MLSSLRACARSLAQLQHLVWGSDSRPPVGSRDSRGPLPHHLSRREALPFPGLRRLLPGVSSRSLSPWLCSAPGPMGHSWRSLPREWSCSGPESAFPSAHSWSVASVPPGGLSRGDERASSESTSAHSRPYGSETQIDLRAGVPRVTLESGEKSKNTDTKSPVTPNPATTREAKHKAGKIQPSPCCRVRV